MSKDRWNHVIVASFLAVPLFASIISTLHIVHFFLLGNMTWMAFFLAVTFEVGSLASFVSLSVLHKVRRGMVMFIFVVLFLMQLVGNVYFSFEYVNERLATNPHWMDTFIELVRPAFDAESVSTYKFILAIVIGAPIPIISLSFMKSLVDYLRVDDPGDPTPDNTEATEVPADSVAQPPVRPIDQSEPVRKRVRRVRSQAAPTQAAPTQMPPSGELDAAHMQS